MEKILLLSILSIIGIGSKEAAAQHFVTSFGVTTSWGVPQYVTDIVYHDYYDFDWVHANRIIRKGHIMYDVVLQQGNFFVELRIGKRGRILRARQYDYYPLARHICDHHCGFHDHYYTAYYRTCHSHHHHGHNHIVYSPRPKNYVYGFYRTMPKYRIAYKAPVYKNNRQYAEKKKAYIVRAQARDNNAAIRRSTRPTQNTRIDRNVKPDVRESTRRSTQQKVQNRSSVKRDAQVRQKQKSSTNIRERQSQTRSKPSVRSRGSESKMEVPRSREKKTTNSRGGRSRGN